eukprot:CAMPEP_0185473886 /NCGR_PEP_ID=MMETSP1366-20130426/1733_1 /TAXON_ID=38817 /ORGANISM="Gephyrocapsa oceanica, Strain RCC1303" /LENGTH=496 /DNA_ID=CAMNT_0028080769 /DNA_START=26 /DNA_END=1516 /DNA_ORIENTATION=-
MQHGVAGKASKSLTHTTPPKTRNSDTQKKLPRALITLPGFPQAASCSFLARIESTTKSVCRSPVESAPLGQRLAHNRREPELLEPLRVAVAHHLERDGAAGLRLLDRADQVLVPPDRLAVDLDDHVSEHDRAVPPPARGETERLCRRAGDHLCEDRAAQGPTQTAGVLLARPVVEQVDAKRRPRVIAELDNLPHHAADGVRGDGEADADVAARAARREDHRVDADEPAARVKERSARVARVDCGVRLDAVFDRPSAVAVDVPAEGGDDARRQGVVEAERIADGQHVLADAQRGGGGDLQRLQRPQPRRVHLEHRQVLVRLMPDDRRLNLALDALQRDHHSRLGRLARDWVGDNVIVGDDVAVGVPDKARASAGLNNAPRREDRGRDEGDGGRGVLKHGHTSRLAWREQWCAALIGLSPPAHRVGIVREGDWLRGAGYDEAGSERHNARVVNGRLEGRRHGCCVARSCCGRESGQATCCRRVGQATCCRREWYAADV